MNADQQTFADHRNLLFSVAYRILGSAADAEDAVQDAWFKWSADDRSQVSDPKAYLARIVSNLAMERLRSTRHQRETYVGPWLPEPILTSRCRRRRRRRRSVSMAMLVVLETLSPLERAVFVLKEVFDFSYAEIARGRRAFRVRGAAGRRTGLASTSRPGGRDSRPTASRSAKPPSGSSPPATGGDINELMELLAPDVTLWTDGGGKVRQALRPVDRRGERRQVDRGAISRPYEGVEIADMTAEVVDINGGPGIVMSGAGRIIATITVDLDADGRIADHPQRRQPRQTARRGRRGQEDLSRLRCGTGRDPLIDSGAILPTCERHCRCQRLGRSLGDNIHVVTENSAR